MDTPSKRNEKIWDKLVQNDVLCSRPKFDLTPTAAFDYINQRGFYQNDFQGKKVLCLAGGGGQQSLAFALLGANVTVVDFSAAQLEKDRLVAAKFDKEIKLIQADMRELSMLEQESFDIIYQPYSINYVPSVAPVFEEVQRLLKPNGIYDLMVHNPYVHGTWKDGCWGNEWQTEELWKGKGYPIWQPYRDGHPIETADPNWNFANKDGDLVKIESPQEYRHTLATMLNGLISRNFELLQFKEEVGTDYTQTPGSWEHYTSCAPPWLYILSRKK